MQSVPRSVCIVMLSIAEMGREQAVYLYGKGAGGVDAARSCCAGVSMVTIELSTPPVSSAGVSLTAATATVPDTKPTELKSVLFP